MARVCAVVPLLHRWTQRADEIEQKLACLIGDSLLGAAAVAYLGPFNVLYRDAAIDAWLQFTDELGVPRSPDFTVVDALCDAVVRRSWSANSLPTDKFSIQNAAIMLKSPVWPLIIDPQVLLCPPVVRVARSSGG